MNYYILCSIYISFFLLSTYTTLKAQCIQNGSFENAEIDIGGNHESLGDGSTVINHWVVGHEGIDYIEGGWEAAHGERSIDLNNWDSGSITQSFSTIVGQTYAVSFDFAGNPVLPPTIKTMQVSVGSFSSIYTFDITGHSTNNMGWTPKVFNFTAIDVVSTLTFLSLNGGPCGPAIDNVRIDCSNFSNVTNQACDDGNPCTVNDVETILNCDGSICIPCSGELMDCDNLINTIIQACDDNNPCTTGETEMILNCDGSICVPCSGGVPTDCSNPDNTTIQACDDGDPCTIGETETILNCDGSICVPCSGGVSLDCNDPINTSIIFCEDGDPCTTGETETILNCDGSVCVPCSGGIPLDCANSNNTSLVVCDDGDPCTIGELETILNCDGSICVPCSGGIPIDCTDPNNMMEVACDDGDACTENDTQIISICDNSICEPCLGTPIDCTDPMNTSVIFCEDGDPCTTGETETILNCDGSVCVPCSGGVPTTCGNLADMEVVNCDDGNPCTTGEVEIVLICDGSVCVPCSGGILVDCDSPDNLEVRACDDNNPCTIDDVETISICDESVCVPCLGIPMDCNTGETTTQSCDDGNPNTTNDIEVILTCDGSICEPCIGIPTDCDDGETTTQSCDDGNPCTINDTETILNSDGSICEPCIGNLMDCSNGETAIQSCDDGDPCTVGETETVLTCDGSICIPCGGGTPIDCNECEQNYTWTTWNDFSGNSATGTIDFDNQSIDVVMSANYNFSSTNGIYSYNTFNDFEGNVPNTTVPRTTWVIGEGGVTTMCFSEVVSNPVLLLSSIGDPGTSVTLEFSLSYISIYDGGGMNFVNDTTIIGTEGYTVLLFPGEFECVTIYSNTYESYTNITWGVNPPLFEVNISGDLTACGSTTLTATGGVSYSWSGGTNPNDATNTFTESGQYILTVTDADGCVVTTSVTIDLEEGSICEPCDETPLDCSDVANTTTQACDDGNPCTVGETETILNCDGSICIPCGGGTILDCDSPDNILVQTCNDNDPCTINDVETISICDELICVPCAGVPVDCNDPEQTITQTCDDDNPNTVDDVEVILACDGSICEPCMGISMDCVSGETTTQSCDDGNPCTINDTETILNSDGSVCEPCEGVSLDCATGETTVQTCEDGDPCTVGETETILNCDGSICIPCGGGTILDCDSPDNILVQTCDDNDPCTINDVETISICNEAICVPCAGVPVDCNDPEQTITQTCDDDNPNTVDDVEIILTCDGSICEPCMGTPTDCDNGETTTQSCDDGNPCTINDTETILNSDGSICEPCMGDLVNCTTGETTTQSCDDGDDCTINDIEIILTCDGSICEPCMGTPTIVTPPNVNSASVCSDTTSVMLSAEGDNGEILWYNDVNIESTTAINQGNMFIYELGNTTNDTLSLWVTQMHGNCESMAALATIIIRPVPNGAVDMEENMLACDVESLSITTMIEADNLTYQWTGPDNFSSNAESVEVSIGGIYYLELIDTLYDCSEIIPIEIIDNRVLPDVEAGQTIELTCFDTIFSLVGSASIGDNFSYQWTTIDGNILQGSQTLNPTINQSGIYYLQVTNEETACVSSDSVEVIALENVPLDAFFIIEQPNCFSATAMITIDEIIGGTAPYTYSLNGLNYTTSNVFNTLSTGIQDIFIQDANGCMLNTAVIIETEHDIDIDLGEDIVIDYGEVANVMAQLTFPTTQLDTIIWTTTDSLELCNTCIEQQLYPLQTVQLTATVIDLYGCTATDNITIYVRTDSPVYIPNAFSPDNDGINDLFHLFAGSRVARVHYFRVFDRWGEFVFQDNDFTPDEAALHAWDGTFLGEPLKPAVFVYVVEVEYTDGTIELFKGDVTLVR